MKKIIISSLLLFILFSTNASAIDPYAHRYSPYDRGRNAGFRNNAGPFGCVVRPIQPVYCMRGEAVCQCDTYSNCSWIFYGC